MYSVELEDKAPGNQVDALRTPDMPDLPDRLDRAVLDYSTLQLTKPTCLRMLW